MVVKDLEILKKQSIIATVVIFIIIIIFRIFNDISSYQEDKSNQKTAIYKQAEFIYNSKVNMISRSLISRLKSIVSQEQVKQAIKNKDRKVLYKISLKRFNTIKNDYNSLSIMHYHLPDHTSLLRVHKQKKYGDNLKQLRPMITKAIQTKTVQLGYESGKHDKDIITYRVALPIIENGILLAVVELGIDTNGILKQINKFFDASYQQKVHLGLLLNNNSNNYRVIANNNFISKIVSKLDFAKKEQSIKFKNNDYFVFWDNNVTTFDNKTIGALIYAFNITKLEIEFKNQLIIAVLKPLIGMILLCLILIWLFNYIIKQSQLHNIKVTSIVDNQKAIIVVTNGNNIIQTNQSFFNFFNIDNLGQFLKDYDCICDKFEKHDGYLQKQHGDKNWIEFVISNFDKNHKVKIFNIENKLHIFQVNIKEFKQEKQMEYVVSFDDITDLEDKNKNLERIVYEKTKELSKSNQDLKTTNHKLELATLDVANESMKVNHLNITLQKSIKKEVEKNRQKDQHLMQQSRLAQMGEMISMIAHQWRQPLAAIGSTSAGINLKAKLNKLDNETAMKLSNKISTYSQHLSSTIDDFREFFKSNKEKRDTTYDELIKSVLNIVEESIINKNIKLVTSLHCTNQINTYPNELKQVILNLLKNAEDILLEKNIKNPQITIQTQDGILKISDNGRGIPEEIFDKIFDPYFSTKKKKDGTGLGLYMSKIIIEEHCGGILSVLNDKDGAVFSIKLDIVKE